MIMHFSKDYYFMKIDKTTTTTFFSYQLFSLVLRGTHILPYKVLYRIVMVMVVD